MGLNSSRNQAALALLLSNPLLEEKTEYQPAIKDDLSSADRRHNLSLHTVRQERGCLSLLTCTNTLPLAAGGEFRTPHMLPCGFAPILRAPGDDLQHLALCDSTHQYTGTLETGTRSCSPLQ